MQSSVRATDVVYPDAATAQTVARVAGEEFTVIVDNIADAQDAVNVAGRLRESIEQPFLVDGAELLTTATIGIASSLAGYERAEDMLRDAGSALRRAQVKGAACELYRAYSVPV
jgi:diguanylate cyclase (GGDEF)-like protein